MIRPGLTLVELLLALVLLASLSMVTIQWSVTMGQAAERAHTEVRWRFAADALLDQIERDVFIGDAARVDDVSHAMGPIDIKDHTLIIHTLHCQTDEAIHRYRLENSSIVLRSNSQRLGTPVLGDVQRFEVVEQDGSLAITLESIRGQISRRTIAIGADS